MPSLQNDSNCFLTTRMLTAQDETGPQHPHSPLPVHERAAPHFVSEETRAQQCHAGEQRFEGKADIVTLGFLSRAYVCSPCHAKPGDPFVFTK